MYFVWLTSCNSPEFSQTCPAWIKISFCVLQYLASRYNFHPQDSESTKPFSISNLERETAALTIAVHILRGGLQVFPRFYLEHLGAYIWKTEKLIFGKLRSSYLENWAAHLKFKETETNILTCERNSNSIHLVVCGCVQCLHCAVKGC